MLNEKSIQNMREVQGVVGAIRTIRGQFNIHPATNLLVYLQDSNERFGNLVPQMEFLAKATFHFNKNRDGFCAPAIVGDLNLFVCLEGLVDKEAEAKRLNQKIEKLVKTIASIKSKLSNETFVAGAPAHIVEGAKKQLEQNEIEYQLLKKSYEMIESSK
jgi:valyl-tRNA synthetase